MNIKAVNKKKGPHHNVVPINPPFADIYAGFLAYFPALPD
ncbi:hypothetical protein ES705_12718 [subsurface metagenome]